jgi:HSP20 family protein
MRIKKKKDVRFFWETTPEKTEAYEEPFEFGFTMPRMTFPEMKFERTIPVHVAETDREVVVHAELPGFKKNDVSLNVTESYVEILATRKTERVERTEKTFMEERQAGALRRAFTLPAKVDPDKTEARLENGILTIVMPKLYPEQKKKRRIDIK